MSVPVGGNYTVLHNFDLLTGDGAVGESTLTAVNSTLYGTTLFGGAYGTELNGIIFKINADGSGYTIMHSFGGAGDGSISSGDLVDSGSILYGACQAGGTGAGTIFKINTDGSGYATLYSFSGGTKSTGPAGGLTLVGSTLYGTTFHGGSHGDGNIFSIDTNGSGYKDLYDFTGGTDGEQPFGTMATDGSFLYGVDDYGGTDYSGVLFRVGLNGRRLYRIARYLRRQLHRTGSDAGWIHAVLPRRRNRSRWWPGHIPDQHERHGL